MCDHQPPCPGPRDAERAEAHRCAIHPAQGWALLCNGVVLFEDGGALLPSGEAIPAPPKRFGLSGTEHGEQVAA